MGVAAETNRSFNQMVRDLEQLEADRALMLAGISHDLRTLARLRLETEMVSSDQATKDAMVDDIEQMDRIIAAFIDYARPSQRKPGLVDLSSIAQEVAARVSGEDGVEIRTRLAPSAVIEADETDMRRVIGNLVENARKYGQSTQDGVSRITLETRVSHARVELSVSDEGPGIPEDQLPLVMRPFSGHRPHQGGRHGPRDGDRAASSAAIAARCGCATATRKRASKLRSNSPAPARRVRLRDALRARSCAAHYRSG